MKNFALSLFILVSLLLAPLRGGEAAPPPPAEGLTLTFETPDFRLESRPDGTWSLTVPQTAPSTEAGFPQLPVYSRLIAVPPQGAVNLEIVRAAGKTLTGRYTLPVAPAPAPLQNDLTPGTWSAVPSRLTAGQVYPQTIARIAEEAWMRDQRLVRVEVFPFQYRGGRLTWYPRVEVRLRFEGGAASPSGGLPASFSGNPLEGSLASAVSNYEQGKSWRGSAPPIVSASSAITTTAYRIGVTEDGLYRLTYADLQSAGLPVDAIDPADFRLSNQGRAVAYAFEGDADAVFEPGEAILFYGEKFRGDYLASLHAGDMDNWLWLCPNCNLKGMFEKYTDENVYWLFTDGGGTLMAALDGTPRDTESVPQWYPATTHAEENHEWYSHHFSSETTWFWERTIRTNTVVTRSYPITLTDLSLAAPYSSTLAASVVSRADNVIHHTTFKLNGHTAYESEWYGKTGHSFSRSIPTAWLAEGENSLDFVIDATGITESLYFDWFEVTYPRHFVAQDDALLFDYPYAGRWQFQVEGLNGNTVYALDVSDPLAPKQILNPRVSASGGGYAAAFEADAAAQSRFLMAEEAAVRTPTVTRYDPAALTPPSGGAEYVFITHRSLLTSTQQLAAYRQSRGLSTFVVDVQDVYNQYGYGIFHPVAIRDYLAEAVASWDTPPVYVLLVGEGNWNFKNYNSSYGTEPILMPPNLAFVDPWQGEVDSANLLAAVAGNDILPDVAIGRLLVSTPEEFDAVFQKITDYESAPAQNWQNNVTFVADNADAAGNFEALSESVINGHIPAGMNVQRIYESEYCGASGCSEMNQAIKATLNITGTLFLNYIGHASLDRWASEQIFVNADVNDLTNRQQLPVVLSMTCLDGFWLFPNSYQASLQEDMLRWASGGSVAAFSPTGLGVATGHDYLNRGFYDAVFQEHTTLGPASIAAKLNLYATGGNYDLIHTFTVFGDPALRFPLPLTMETADEQSGEPGETLTYRLWGRNTTALTQTLTLSLDGNTWPSAPLAQTTPLLAPGAGAPLTVTVTIPGEAHPPQTDVLTATLRGDTGGETLGVVYLTSRVNGARGVSLTPAYLSQDALPGETVTYTLRLTNTGTLTDTYGLYVNGAVWPTHAPGSIGPLSPGAARTFTLTVQVTAGAADGTYDDITLSAVSEAVPTIRASATLKTRSVWHHTYLPLTIR